ncbi:MAG: glycosyltransferase family 39 protein [Elusimicrobia bacterium]|nr:glycosyltransferase family 39 protein [Elusimicrobiota bacterium]
MNLRRLAAVGLLALGLRVGFVVTHSRGDRELVADALQYHAYAVHMVQDGRYVDEKGDRLFRMPGYPVFLAAVYWVFGPSVAAVQLVQALLSALACLCLYGAARRLYGEGWGLACGLAAAVYRGLVASCTYLLTESLVSSLLCLFLWLWYCGTGWSRSVQSLALAAALAAVCIIRPDLGPFILAAGFSLPWFESRFSRRHALLWIPVFLALFAPWVVRNYLVFCEVVVSGTQGQAAPYYGLAFPLESLGDAPPPPLLPGGMPELEQKAYYSRSFAALWAATPPWRILRAYAFNVASMFYPFLPAYDWSYMLLAPFWLWALRRWRAMPESRILWLLFFLYTAVHVFAGGPVSRYRETLSAPLLLLAAAGARDLRERLGPRFWGWAGGYAALNLAVWLFAEQTRGIVLWLKALLLVRSA